MLNWRRPVILGWISFPVYRNAPQGVLIHSAAESQPKEITPSFPSPLEGEGESGGDAFCLMKNEKIARKHYRGKRIIMETRIIEMLGII
jgi:hypothetical protein